MNFGKSFTYIFDDSDWFNKVIIPILIGLIPVVGQLVVTGWMLDLTKNVSNRVGEPLPELDFGRQLGRGFRWWLVMLVYSLPMIVLSFLIAIPAVAISDSSAGLKGIFAVVFVILLGFLLFLYGLALALFLPAAQATFAIKDDIKSALDYKFIFELIKNNYTAWLLVIAGTIVGSFIAPLGGIVLGIGAIVTAFYSQAMVAHLAGQAYTLSQAKDGVGIPAY